VILNHGDDETWLNPKLTYVAVLQEFRRPSYADILSAYPVSPMVNSPKNDSIDCIAPISKGTDKNV
jgi:putative SOS response-associated peptidase YedK